MRVKRLWSETVGEMALGALSLLPQSCNCKSERRVHGCGLGKKDDTEGQAGDSYSGAISWHYLRDGQ